MRNILLEIAEKTRNRVEKIKLDKPLELVKKEAQRMDENTGFPFERALSKRGISFICEVKKASPSKGLIAKDFPYLEIAKEYEAAGASAISVLTEPEYFMGSDVFLKEIAQNVNIPVLRKDFTVDSYQIYEAKLLGASAVLLICAILNQEEITQFIQIADSLGLSALVEAHNEAEVKMAVSCGARVIGVNNRNLVDFSVDINNSIQLRKLCPQNIIFVSESGIKTHEDIKNLMDNQTDAVLIGETFMRSENKQQMLHELETGRMTRVKICGLTREDEVDKLNGLPQEMLPDYAGVVFAKSKRQVTLEKAKQIKKLLDQKIKLCGVFVNDIVEHVAILVNDHVIDMVQLHGEEDNSYIRKLRQLAPGVKIMKAVKVKDENDIKKAEAFDADFLLFDAFPDEKKDGKYAGGNGQTFDWSLINNVKKPYFLAGGLTSENVGEAIQKLHPYAVDVSSGVETDGGKDIEKIAAFIKNVE